MGDGSAGVTDGHNAGGFPIDLSILLLVAKLPAPFTSTEHGPPELPVHRRRLYPRIQNARVSADRLLRRIARHLGKFAIDVFDRALCIGDDHDGRALLNRA